MQCNICEKNKHYNHLEIYRNDNIVVSHAPINANILGYLYIEPIEHYENWSDIPIEVLINVHSAIQKIDLLLRREQLAERVYSVTISEMVRHIHFHIIPRQKGTKIKGIALIEKATQQLSNENNNELKDKHIDQFIKKAKIALSE